MENLPNVKAEVLTKPEAYCYRHTARLGLDSVLRLENTGGKFWGIKLLQRVVYILLVTPNLRHDIARQRDCGVRHKYTTGAQAVQRVRVEL